MKKIKYLCRADTDWLPENNPGDTFQQGGCGKRAVIGPIIQWTGKKRLWVKVGKVHLLSLEGQKRESLERKKESNCLSLWTNCCEFLKPITCYNLSPNCGTVFFTLVLMAFKASKTFWIRGLAAPIWSRTTQIHTKFYLQYFYNIVFIIWLLAYGSNL